MTLRTVVWLAWLLMLPGLALGQTPAARRHAPAAPSAASAAVPAPSGPPLIDVNSADEKALDSLPGVGPVRAKAIVAGRPYTDKQDLLTKKTVPANVFADIRDKVALINVNSATAAFMAKVLPNVGPVRAQKIVDGRPYASLPELVSKGALTAGVYSGLMGLITIGQ